MRLAFSLELRIFLFKILLSLFKRDGILLLIGFFFFCSVFLDFLNNEADNDDWSNNGHDGTDNNNCNNPALESTITISRLWVELFPIIFEGDLKNRIVVEIFSILKTIFHFCIVLALFFIVIDLTRDVTFHNGWTFSCVDHLSIVVIESILNDGIDIFTEWFDFFTEEFKRHVNSNCILYVILVNTETGNTKDESWFAWKTVGGFIDTCEAIVITFCTVSCILFVLFDHIMSWVTDVAELLGSAGETVISAFEAFSVWGDVIIGGTLGAVLRSVHIAWDTIGFSRGAL